VAIKVSAQQFRERFEREAKAIAALNHPNICTLRDIGPNYLVMEFIEDAAPWSSNLTTSDSMAQQSADLGYPLTSDLETRLAKPVDHVRIMTEENIETRKDAKSTVLLYSRSGAGNLSQRIRSACRYFKNTQGL
jgi:hypothetical protein